MTFTMLPTLALFGTFGWQEMVLLGILGILIFGKRLPEVGKSLGRGIVEFKKGIAGIEDEVNHAATHTTTRTPPQIEKHEAPTVTPAKAPEEAAPGGSSPV